MKQCVKCGLLLPLDDFYKHEQMTDGRLSSCKRCVRTAVKSNRDGKAEYYREFDRERYRTDPLRRALVFVSSRALRRLYPEKYRARTAVNNAVRDGRLIRLPCEVCGAEKSEAHHDDYSKPLIVRWLCRLHHEAYHHAAA